MCIHSSDNRADEELMIFDSLCDNCRDMVNKAGCRLYDKLPTEWGFCEKCDKAIAEVIEELNRQ